MSRKNIALLAGGFTGEYEVSVNSANNITANLSPEKYSVYTIFIKYNILHYTTLLNSDTDATKLVTYKFIYPFPQFALPIATLRSNHQQIISTSSLFIKHLTSF